MRAHAERSHERNVELGKLADGRIVEMVVMIVRHDDQVDRQHAAAMRPARAESAWDLRAEKAMRALPTPGR